MRFNVRLMLRPRYLLECCMYPPPDYAWPRAVAGAPMKALAAAILFGTSVAAPAQAAESNAPVAEMESVVVTASGFEQNVVDAPASISVIPRQKLEQGNYRDLNDALRDIPGVIITSNGDKDRKSVV